MAAFVLLAERSGADAITSDDVREALGLEVGLGVFVERVFTRDALVEALSTQPWQVVLVAMDFPGAPAVDTLALVRGAGLCAPVVVLADPAQRDDAVEVVELGAFDLVLRDERWRLRVSLLRALRVSTARPEPRRVEVPWLHAVLDQLADGLLVVDHDGRIVWMNSAASRLVEYARGGPAGFGAWVHLPDAWRRPADAPPVEVSASRPDGTAFPVEVQARPVRVPDGDLVAYTLRDLTERRDLERQLQQAQRLEAVAHLSTGVAHEFNNILTGVLTYASLLRRELGPEHGCIDDVGEIEAAGERAAILVRQLLSLSRRQPAVLREMDLNRIVRDATSFLTRVIGPQIDLLVTPGVDLPMIEADPALVEQVLTNLIVNARDAMPAGGTARVATRLVTLAEPHAGLLPVPAGAYVEMEVSDNGAGMDVATLRQCLDPFFTTRQGGQWSGLGLPVVHGVMRQHRGYLELDSEPGRGLRVRVGFPVQAHAVVAVPIEVPALPTQGRETVLVAEDDAAVRAVMVRVLESQGYTVVQACDGTVASRLFRESPARFDVAVLDLLMPHQGGIDLYRELLEVRPNLRVLWVSGYGGGRQLSLTRSSDFLPKPFNSTEFVRRVRALLDRPEET